MIVWSMEEKLSKPAKPSDSLTPTPSCTLSHLSLLSFAELSTVKKNLHACTNKFCRILDWDIQSKTHILKWTYTSLLRLASYFTLMLFFLLAWMWTYQHWPLEDHLNWLFAIPILLVSLFNPLNLANHKVLFTSNIASSKQILASIATFFFFFQIYI